jgi:uncharacterized membrane protein YhhN
MKFASYLYILIGALDVAIEFSGHTSLRYITRPLLMPVLIAFYALGAGALVKRDRLIISALVFSWFGDLALMAAGADNKILFLTGLVSFLVAHIFYINAYIIVRDRSAAMLLPKKLWLVIPIFAFLGGMLYLVLPTVPPDMWAPITVYALVIGTMSAFAMNRYGRVSDRSFALVFGGALIFMLSDSLIAINTFLCHGTLYMAGVWIMSTYIAGQYLIVKGMLRNEMPD